MRTRQTPIAGPGLLSVGAVLAPLALLTGMAPVALAQSKTGTTTGQFLRIEPSARQAAMGNAGVALAGEIGGLYYNPGVAGTIGERALQLAHSEWFAGIDYDYFAGTLPLGALGTVFGSVTVLDSGEIDVRTVSQPLGTGERYSVTDVAVALGYGRQITDRFSAGLRLTYANETIWNSSNSQVALDLGTVYRVPLSGLSLGTSLSNLSGRSSFSGRDLAIQYDADPDANGDNSALPAEQFTGEFSLPLLFRVGLAYPFARGERNEFLLAVDAHHPSDDPESLSLGGEWTWARTLSLRLGYQELFLEDAEFGVTAGVGLATGLAGGDFRFDYAWADHDHLDETHRFTVVLAF